MPTRRSATCSGVRFARLAAWPPPIFSIPTSQMQHDNPLLIPNRRNEIGLPDYSTGHFRIRQISLNRSDANTDPAPASQRRGDDRLSPALSPQLILHWRLSGAVNSTLGNPNYLRRRSSRCRRIENRGPMGPHANGPNPHRSVVIRGPWWQQLIGALEQIPVHKPQTYPQVINTILPNYPQGWG